MQSYRGVLVGRRHNWGHIGGMPTQLKSALLVGVGSRPLPPAGQEDPVPRGIKEVREVMVMSHQSVIDSTVQYCH